MKRIGITGGIGAGKSLVCRVFHLYGIPYYSADERAKWLQVHSESVRAEILQLFGNRAYLPDGSLNRAYIGGIVFNDQSMLKKLNQIVHPAVAEDFEKWCLERQDKPFVLKEAALLFETGSHKQLDAVINVYAEMPLRVERTLFRDPHRTTEEVEKIINQQMPDEERLKLADYTIYNDESSSLIRQVDHIYHVIANL